MCRPMWQGGISKIRAAFLLAAKSHGHVELKVQEAWQCFWALYVLLNVPIICTSSHTPCLLDYTDVSLSDTNAQQPSSLPNTSEKGASLLLTPKEVKAKKFHLRYDVITDTYSRLSDGSSGKEGWLALAKDFNNIKRLEDRHDRVAYLARSSKKIGLILKDRNEQYFKGGAKPLFQEVKLASNEVSQISNKLA